MQWIISLKYMVLTFPFWSPIGRSKVVCKTEGAFFYVCILLTVYNFSQNKLCSCCPICLRFYCWKLWTRVSFAVESVVTTEIHPFIDRHCSLISSLHRKDGVPIGYKGCTFHRYATGRIGVGQILSLKMLFLTASKGGWSKYTSVRGYILKPM